MVVELGHSSTQSEEAPDASSLFFGLRAMVFESVGPVRHEVSIPLQDFFGGKGAECDAHTAWEFRVGSWSGTPVNFDLVIDNLVVAKK